jgi:hypothetical protein
MREMVAAGVRCAARNGCVKRADLAAAAALARGFNASNDLPAAISFRIALQIISPIRASIEIVER